jgi:glycosyltransferase involved in cell wall biosynthesis
MNTKRPTISVVVGTHNGARFIGEQFESILRQSVPVDEVLVVDDASTDNSPEIVEGFVRRDPRFSLRISAVNKGYRQTYYDLVAAAAGDIIFVCDQDDIWMDTKVERIVSALAPEDCLVAYHAAIVADAEGKPLRELDGYRVRGSGFSFDTAPHLLFSSLGFTQAYKRSLTRFNDLIPASVDHNALDQPLAYDQFYSFIASLLGRVAYVQEPQAYYRQHGGNLDGWRGRRSPLTRLTRRSSAAWRHRFVAACRARVAIIRELQKREPAVAATLEPFAARFEAAASLYQERLSLYDAPALTTRLGAFASLGARRGYIRSLGGELGLKTALQDLLVGVLQVGAGAK